MTRRSTMLAASGLAVALAAAVPALGQSNNLPTPPPEATGELGNFGFGQFRNLQIMLVGPEQRSAWRALEDRQITERRALEDRQAAELRQLLQKQAAERDALLRTFAQ